MRHQVKSAITKGGCITWKIAKNCLNWSGIPEDFVNLLIESPNESFALLVKLLLGYNLYNTKS